MALAFYGVLPALCLKMAVRHVSGRLLPESAKTAAVSTAAVISILQRLLQGFQSDALFILERLIQFAQN